MFIDQLATDADVIRLLGEIDQLTIARILAIAPTVDELDEAVQATADEAGFGEEPRTPSSARVQSIRAVLAELAEEEIEGVGAEPQEAWRS